MFQVKFCESSLTGNAVPEPYHTACCGTIRATSTINSFRASAGRIFIAERGCVLEVAYAFIGLSVCSLRSPRWEVNGGPISVEKKHLGLEGLQN